MNDSSAEDLATSARELISALAKGKKTLRMYPENNPIYERTVDEVAQRVEACLSADDLTLQIRQFEILLGDTPVYENPEKEDNFALFFFKDGIRELTFRQGLTYREIVDFLKIISMDFEREAIEDDIVTLLWEREFDFIRYKADDEFILVDEDYEQAALEGLQVRGLPEENVQKAYQEALVEEMMAVEEDRSLPTSTFVLSDRELDEISSRLDREDQEIERKIVQILTELLYESDSPESFDEVVGFFEQTVHYFISRADFSIAQKALRHLRDLQTSDAFSEERRKQLRRIAQNIAGSRTINEIGTLIDTEKLIDTKSFTSFMTELDRRAIGGFLALLGDLKTIHGRRLLIEGLVALGRKDVDAVAQGLRDNRWFVVRNTILILGRIGDKRAVDFLRNALGHGDERVRKEVVRALGSFPGPNILPHLREALGDESPAVRSMAARAFGTVGNSPVAKKIILEEIKKKDFARKDLAEKKSFFEALSSWHDEDVLAFLKQSISRKSLLRRSSQDDTRVAAAFALALMGRDADVAELINGSDNPAVRQAVREARQRIAERQTERT